MLPLLLQIKILTKFYKQIQAQSLQTQSRIHPPPPPNNFHKLKIIKSRKTMFLSSFS
ncbi:hypothetical protein C2G38_2059946 [Gigaspora rosea]|uniref:Uncharacterized protein n=1 Tax=Gigaspora rosea TaxID=44941 RepID=A0A397W7C1_9GLOM|nr:hypothetical protein C2G38_2059946 [Gigaspora rosea]